MDNQVASNDKENEYPSSNVPEVVAPKIYTIESKFNVIETSQTFTYFSIF
jgi:hypothetical protein